MGPFLGGYPGRFDPRFVAKRLEYYDYASSHVRWDGPAFRSVFPSDTKYLTVLREPLSHFESTFNFFYSRHHTLASAQGRKNDICCWGMPFSAVAGWDTDAVTYLRMAPDRWNSSIPWAGRGRNFQAFELGWDVDQTDDKYLQDKIKEMESGQGGNHFEGYIDVGDGCWWRTLVTDVGEEMYWWQLLDVGDVFGHIGHQHPLSFFITVGYQYSKDVSNIKFLPS